MNHIDNALSFSFICHTENWYSIKIFFTSYRKLEIDQTFYSTTSTFSSGYGPFVLFLVEFLIS